MYTKRVFKLVSTTNERRIGQLCTYTVKVVLRTQYCLFGFPLFTKDTLMSETPEIRPCDVNQKIN